MANAYTNMVYAVYCKCDRYAGEKLDRQAVSSTVSVMSLAKAANVLSVLMVTSRWITFDLASYRTVAMVGGALLMSRSPLKAR
jgi:hypothetical protein